MSIKVLSVYVIVCNMLSHIGTYGTLGFIFAVGLLAKADLFVHVKSLQHST